MSAGLGEVMEALLYGGTASDTSLSCRRGRRLLGALTVTSLASHQPNKFQRILRRRPANNLLFDRKLANAAYWTRVNRYDESTSEILRAMIAGSGIN
jgi:hypothetical protein